jgi:hypothetical protein
MKKFVPACFALALLAVACGQQNAGVPSAPMQAHSLSRTAGEPTVGADTIGIELPGEGLGTVKDVKFGTVGGYTQSTRSQIIAFKPNLTITITNLSKVISHTLNVLSTTNFPPHPVLKTQRSGGPLQLGYASGILGPGKSVKVVLSKPGIYYVGCAFHYPSNPSMRDVIKVFVKATPGPQATP